MYADGMLSDASVTKPKSPPYGDVYLSVDLSAATAQSLIRLSVLSGLLSLLLHLLQQCAEFDTNHQTDIVPYFYDRMIPILCLRYRYPLLTIPQGGYYNEFGLSTLSPSYVHLRKRIIDRFNQQKLTINFAFWIF